MTEAPVALSEWEFHDAPDEYQLVEDSECLDAVFRDRFKNDLECIQESAKRMSAAAYDGDEITDDSYSGASTLPVFFALSSGLFATTLSWANKKIRRRNSEARQSELQRIIAPIEHWEFISFLAVFAGTELINLSLDEAISLLQAHYSVCTTQLAATSPVLKKGRYLQILKTLTAIDPDAHSAGPDNWRAGVDTIEECRPFEAKVYEQCRRMFLNSFSTLVLDDELIGSQSSTVESLARSSRKADGKSGFKNDAIASSFLRLFVAVKHKERLDYNQMSTAKDLIQAVAKHVSITDTDRMLLTADRGYSKLALWKFLAGENVQFIMVANKGATVAHPFKFLSEVRLQEQKKAAVLAKKQALEEKGKQTRSYTEARATVLKMVQDATENENTQEEQEEQEEQGDAEAVQETDAASEVGNDALALGHAQAPIQLDEDETDVDRVIETANGDNLDVFYAEEGEPDDDLASVLGATDDENPVPMAKHIIDDDFDLGKELFSATCTVTSEGRASKIVACAFRDYTKRNGKGANGLRFVGSVSDEHAQRFHDTICMERLSISRNIKKKDEILFFPGEGSEARHALENTLLDKTTPLTCWQRCADWFVCREFIVTGTVAQKLGKIDQDARQLLLANPGVAPDVDEKQIAETLFKSWVFKSFTGTAAMKTGNMNERNVFLSVRSQDWCSAIYEAGLFASKEFPCVAASPDGVARVHLPSVDGAYPPNNEANTVICSVEIKTRSSVEMQIRAAEIRTDYGPYFQVECGSNDWFRVVPRANRGQVLAQAAALGVDYVLFTESIAGRRLFSALVHVTGEQRKIFADSIEKWKHLIEWATESLESAGPPPSPPDAFSPRARKVLSSRLRLWRAVRKLIKERGRPLYPVRLFKCLIQVLYNKMKGGIDGSTQYVKAISGHRKKEVPQSMELILILRAVKHIFVNSAIALRILNTKLDDEASLKTLRSRLADSESMNDTTFKLCMQLLCAASRSRSNAANLPSENLVEEDSEQQLSETEVRTIQEAIKAYTQKKRKIEDMQTSFNVKPAWKRLRRSKNHDHKLARIENTGNTGQLVKKQKQGICAACARHTCFYCTTCLIPLHGAMVNCNSKEREGTAGCFARWHRNDFVKLTAAAKEDLKRKREMSKQRTKRRSSETPSPPPPTPTQPPPQPPA